MISDTFYRNGRKIFNPMFIYKHDKYPKSNDYIEPLNRSNEKRFYVGNRFLYSRKMGSINLYV